MTISQLTNLKIKTIKKELHTLFSRNLNEKKKMKSSTFVLIFFFNFGINEMLQFLLSIFISAEKRMVIWVHGLYTDYQATVKSL